VKLENVREFSQTEAMENFNKSDACITFDLQSGRYEIAVKQ